MILTTIDSQCNYVWMETRVMIDCHPWCSSFAPLAPTLLLLATLYPYRQCISFLLSFHSVNFNVAVFRSGGHVIAVPSVWYLHAGQLFGTRLTTHHRKRYVPVIWWPACCASCDVYPYAISLCNYVWMETRVMVVLAAFHPLPAHGNAGWN